MVEVSAKVTSEARARLSMHMAPGEAYRLWLDLFRWSAAVLVLNTHVVNRLIGPPHDLPTYGLTFLQGFSHPAVMVFFVLSGYLVGGALLKERRAHGTINVRLYAAKRFSRLWTVLLPALALTWACNRLALDIFAGASSGLYPKDVDIQGNLPTLVCNMVFLQTVSCPTFGGNGPLWSLFNEFWYYVVWLIAVGAFVTTKLVARIALIALALAILIGLTLPQREGYAMGPWMIVWLIGALVAMAKAPLVRSPSLAATATLAYLIGTRLLVRREVGADFPMLMLLIDVGLALVFGNLMLSLKYTSKLRAPPGGMLNERMAGFCFSLYCIHLPVLCLYGAIVCHQWKASLPLAFHSASDWFIVAGAFLTTLVASYVFSIFTEKHTAQVKSVMAHVLGANRSPGHLPLSI